MGEWIVRIHLELSEYNNFEQGLMWELQNRYIFINHRQQATQTNIWNNGFQILDKKQWKPVIAEKSKMNDVNPENPPDYHWRQLVGNNSRKKELKSLADSVKKREIEVWVGQQGQNSGAHTALEKRKLHSIREVREGSGDPQMSILESLVECLSAQTWEKTYQGWRKSTKKTGGWKLFISSLE